MAKGPKATFQSECGLSTWFEVARDETICAAQRIFILTQSRIARAICTSLRYFGGLCTIFSPGYAEKRTGSLGDKSS
jgi:hypothetical protein